jgi:hypothetical protein
VMIAGQRNRQAERMWFFSVTISSFMLWLYLEYPGLRRLAHFAGENDSRRVGQHCTAFGSFYPGDP